MAWNGNKGKFSERIKRIRLARLKNKENQTNYDNNVIYNNFLKVAAAIPLMVYDNVVLSRKNEIEKNESDNEKIEDSKVNLDGNFVNQHKNNDNIKNKRTEKINKANVDKKIKISDIDVSQIKKNQEEFYNRSYNYKNNSNEETKKADPKELEKRIINLIKKNLITMVNELEILQSDLYVLSEVNGEDVELNNCRKNVDEVKKILCKIDKLKKKYDFLRDNFDFEYMLETNDLQLVDDIITLKEQFSKNEVRATVEDYKLLDVYKFLYLRIDQLRDDMIKFEEYKEQKVEELKERDIDFDKLKNDVYNVEKTNESYNYFVREQEDFFRDLNEKISKIDMHEDVSYRLKGFNRFLFNSFKYVGLLMLSPLKGIVPSIATETVLTRNVVSNLYNNIEIEETRRMVYEAIDYSSEIRNAISDLNNTGKLVDMTLEDITKLKMKYNEQFKKYQGDFYEYEEVIRRINDMENKILGNKIKIEIMKSKMKEKEMENSKKLIKVKELNDQAA